VTGIVLATRSPAKINWTLRVLARRPDGFHEIESLVSAVTLHDELTFECRSGSAIEIRCDQTQIPTDERNLIARAALRLGECAGRSPGITCRLTKQIPVGGGLGGGSSNAAATFLALNRLWDLNWPVDRLEPLAAELGSDVPFFLAGGSAVMSGRGERIRPVRLGWHGWVVLLIPGFGISTADVYRAWRPDDTPVSDSECLAHGTLEQEETPDAVAWMQRTGNMLETPAMRVCPALGGVLEGAARLADRPVRMSGSGSTLFTAFDTREEADRFAEEATLRLDVKARVVQPAERADEQAQTSRTAARNEIESRQQG
jgi:4-diphosphocytidyl-2-C-methyl-D-erythritol kinase